MKIDANIAKKKRDLQRVLYDTRTEHGSGDWLLMRIMLSELILCVM